MKKANRESFNSLCKELASGGDHFIFVERYNDTAIHANPLGHLADQVWRYQHSRLLDGHRVDVGPSLPLNREHVPEAARGDKAGSAALTFQHRIGRGRGPVKQLGHVLDPGIQSFFQSLNHSARRIDGRRGHFVRTKTSILADPDQVGKSSASLNRHFDQSELLFSYMRTLQDIRMSSQDEPDPDRLSIS